MRLLLVSALLAILFIFARASTGFVSSPVSTGFVSSPTRTGPKSAPEQPDISRSGRDFLEVCTSVNSGGGVNSEGGIDSEGNRNPARDPARIGRDATCLGWVEGFTEGFTVHEELLNVPRRDRMACVPHGVTTVQTVRVIKKYLADNPGKAHRPTRYIASIALAGAFPCKAGK